LDKYGPGPKVHYHCGVIEPDVPPASDAEGIRQQLIQSQNKMLGEAADLWQAEKHLSGTIVDIGCGLGGGSIFWAQEYGARVFSLTNIPKHVGFITRFAAQAGVAHQVTPLLGDAHAIPGEQIFEAAVAINSSCHLNREVWFQQLASRLQPGGQVFILDIFLGNENSRELIDRYYHTRIGKMDEYETAASAAGFSLNTVLDVTARSVKFWDFSVLYSRRLIEAGMVTDKEELKRLERSISFHIWLGQQYADRDIIYALLSFARA